MGRGRKGKEGGGGERAGTGLLFLDDANKKLKLIFTGQVLLAPVGITQHVS